MSRRAGVIALFITVLVQSLHAAGEVFFEQPDTQVAGVVVRGSKN